MSISRFWVMLGIFALIMLMTTTSAEAQGKKRVRVYSKDAKEVLLYTKYRSVSYRYAKLRKQGRCKRPSACLRAAKDQVRY